MLLGCCIVDCVADVEAAPGVGIGDVLDHERRPVAQLLGRGPAGGLVQIGEQDRRALGKKLFHAGPADTAQSAGNQTDLALQIPHVRSPPLLWS